MSQFLSLVTSLRFAEFDFGLIIVVAEATCNDLCFSSLLDFTSPQFKDCSKMLLHFEDLRKLLVHLEHEVVRKYFLSNFTIPMRFLFELFACLSFEYRSCTQLQS